MSRELQILHAQEEIKRKKPREASIRQEAARTDLKIKSVHVKDVLSGKIKLTDPCIVMCTHCDTHAALERLYPDVRKITFTGTDEKLRSVSTIQHDSYAMACDIMGYLAGAGRKKVALFGFDRLSVYTRSTLLAFQKAAELFCISLSMNDIFLNETRLETCMYNLFQQIHRYDAVVCVNDYAAAFVSTKLLKAGIRIPEDMFVIGRGNSLISSEIKPSLTTVDYMEENVGKESISLYWYLVRHPEIFRTDVFVNYKLIVRRSTADLPTYKINSTLPVPDSIVYEDRGYGNLIRLEIVLSSGDAVTRQILRMLENYTTEQIAAELYMSESAVKYRISNIAKILGVKSRKEICRILRTYPLTFMNE